jgi:alpha,alpha-trehalose-phosphate synthase [UDP-forming]
MWTEQTLRELIQSRMKDYRFIVVANREPYIHRYVGDRIECFKPASGMATALDPIMHAGRGTWIAHGGGNADKATVDEHDRVAVPPEEPKYTLRRVWLTKEQEDGYYYGLSNEGLWPLCHVAYARPQFDPKHWETYREVNQQFARAVLEEAGDQPTFVFIQDYHFCLLPRLLKSANAKLVIAQFWHIPWPSRETFRAFPWKEELLDGLLGNDLLGFHIRHHCLNFLDTVDRGIEARVDQEHFKITRGGSTTMVRPFPISIDFEQHAALAGGSEVERMMLRWRERLGARVEFIGVGVERLDYTKGIPDRLRAIDYLLEKRPEYCEKLVFVQIAVPSRAHISLYQQLDNEVEELVEKINWKWGTGSWQPILFLKEHHSPVEMISLHRLAQFCMVSSLHDGMNLVAKEFVASRVDEDGVLILSKFTGAARELNDALQVNPFAVHEMAEAMHQSLVMPADDRRKRMIRMREQVAQNNVYRWAGKIISTLLKFDFPEDT